MKASPSATSVLKKPQVVMQPSPSATQDMPLLHFEGMGHERDWFLVAQFEPGFSDDKPWETRISDSGRVEQDKLTFLNGAPSIAISQRRTLNSTELQKLRNPRLLDGFFRLKESYDESITDCPTLFLSVNDGHRFKRVRLYRGYLLGRNKDREKEVAPFMDLLDIVVGQIPDPNRP